MKNCSTGMIVVLTALSLCVLNHLVGSAPADVHDSAGTILVLPFRLDGCEQNKDILDFAGHVNRQLKSAIHLKQGALRIATEDTLRVLLEEHGLPENNQEAASMGRAASADWVIFGHLSCSDSSYRLKGVMWDLKKDRPSVVTDFEAGSIFHLPSILQVFIRNINARIHGSPRLPLYAGTEGEPTPRLTGTHPSPGPSKKRGPWRSPEIPVALRSLDVGDLDGDGENEIVLVNENGVSIRKFEQGSLKTLSQFSESPASYIGSEVEDVNGDGISELIVSYRKPSRIESAVIRYVGRNLRVTDRFPNVIATAIADVANPERHLLVGQRTDSEKMFNGDMILYREENGRFEPAGVTMLPPGTFILSYAAGYLGEQPTFMRVILNQDRRLMVFDRENRLLFSVTDRMYGFDRRIQLPGSDGTDREITFPGRLLIDDTNGDGENELLVIKHSGGGSEIQDLVWDGGEFKEKWKTIRSRGILCDFRIHDFKNSGTRSLVAILLRTNPLNLLLGGTRSVVFAYDLGL